MRLPRAGAPRSRNSVCAGDRVSRRAAPRTIHQGESLMTINTSASAPASSVSSTSTFGQRIEAALVAAWSDAKADGAALLASAEAFGERELGVVEAAIVQTWNIYEPKAVALLQTYVENALSELGSGASIEQVAESVVAQDAEQGAASFLEGAVSAGLKAIVSALIASL
jgi:hypothetical protein